MNLCRHEKPYLEDLGEVGSADALDENWSAQFVAVVEGSGIERQELLHSGKVVFDNPLDVVCQPPLDVFLESLDRLLDVEVSAVEELVLDDWIAESGVLNGHIRCDMGVHEHHLVLLVRSECQLLSLIHPRGALGLSSLHHAVLCMVNCCSRH